MSTGTRASRQSETVTEVMFKVTDETYPFVGASKAEDCRLTLENLVPQSDGDYLEVFSLTGGSSQEILELAKDDERVESRLLSEQEEESLLEFKVSGGCVAVSLADLGAIPRELGAESGDGWVVASIPPTQDSKEVLKSFLEEHPMAELKARRKRTPSNSLAAKEGLESIESELTPEEVEVLQAAHEMGYFQWPNYSAGENVADTLEMDENEFYDHFYAAQRKLLSKLFGDSPPFGDTQSPSAGD